MRASSTLTSCCVVSILSASWYLSIRTAASCVLLRIPNENAAKCLSMRCFLWSGCCDFFVNLSELMHCHRRNPPPWRLVKIWRQTRRPWWRRSSQQYRQNTSPPCMRFQALTKVCIDGTERPWMKYLMMREDVWPLQKVREAHPWSLKLKKKSSNYIVIEVWWMRAANFRVCCRQSKRNVVEAPITRSTLFLPSDAY